MKWFSDLRALVYLRRIVRSLEELAAIERERLQMQQQDWEAAHAPRPRKKPDLAFFDQEEANRRWKAQQVERMIEVDEEQI